VRIAVVRQEIGDRLAAYQFAACAVLSTNVTDLASPDFPVKRSESLADVAVQLIPLIN
jgi:hypothetical protein